VRNINWKILQLKQTMFEYFVALTPKNCNLARLEHFTAHLLRLWLPGLMMHSVVVVNTISTSFWVVNSIHFTFLLVFTTRKLVAFNSMIIPTSQHWPL